MDWSDWLDLAIGQLGLLPDQFYAMTYGEFFRYAYFRDFVVTTQWQQARFMAVSMQKAMGAKNVDETKILPLWTDRLGETSAGHVIPAGPEFDAWLKKKEEEAAKK